MDLKLKDVAQLLRVSIPEVQQWLAEGKIPSYRMADEVRFNRAELENWLIHYGLPNDPIAPIDALNDGTHADAVEHGLLKFDFYRSIFRGEVFHEIDSVSKEQIIERTTQRLAKKYPLDSEHLYQLLVAREKLTPTGLGQGVAVPHTRDFLINTHFDAVCVVYPKQPLAWGSIDKELVHTLFFVFACSDKSHLHLLAKIAGFCQQKQHLRLLQSRPDKQKLLETVLRWERHL